MVQRVVGLASGMDIDSMVQKLMSAERVPLDQLKQKKQILTWQQDDYRTMNSAFLDLQNTLMNMRFSTQYRARTTVSSNENLVTATASSGADLSSYAISSVEQLAGAATRVNAVAISGGTKIDPTGKLYDQQFSDPTFAWKPGSVQSQALNVTTNGQAPSINLNGGTLIDSGAMNIQLNGKNYKAVTDPALLNDDSVLIDTATGSLQFSANVTSTIKVGNIIQADYVIDSATDYYSSFNIQTYDHNGNPQSQNFLVNGKDSLNTVISKVNGSTVGVTMYYDSFKDQVTLTRKETGQFNTAVQNSEIATTGDFINSALQFQGSTESGGQNAIFTINGLSTQKSTNTFQMSGVTFTLKQAFNTSDPMNPNPAAPVSISINNDTDSVFNNIKGFIDKYNALIETVNSKLNEERNRDYKPLTDDQRTAMSDTQQQQWDAKAKSGLLRGDDILSGALAQMRSLVYQSVQNINVSSAYNQLVSVGITTTSDYFDGGKLKINDEDKLKAAIQNDPKSVENLFSGSGDTTASKGIVERLYDSVSDIMDQLKDKAGSAGLPYNKFVIGQSLHDMDDQILTLNDRLTQIEDRYYNQFNAMDQAIQKANSQASYIAQYFK